MLMTQMVQYLLAYRRPTGGRIVRYGATQTTIPIFPAGMTLVFDVYPALNAHTNLYFWNRPSPAMIPGAFMGTTSQEGIEVTSGVARDLVLAEGHQIWLEVTQASPIRNIIINTTNLNQFFENLDTFLIVDTEEDMKEVRRLINEWHAAEAMAGMNRLLTTLIQTSQEGQGVQAPAPPVVPRPEAPFGPQPPDIRHLVGM